MVDGRRYHPCRGRGRSLWWVVPLVGCYNPVGYIRHPEIEARWMGGKQQQQFLVLLPWTLSGHGAMELLDRRVQVGAAVTH
jgi:hypothetical protein